MAYRSIINQVADSIVGLALLVAVFSMENDVASSISYRPILTSKIAYIFSGIKILIFIYIVFSPTLNNNMFRAIALSIVAILFLLALYLVHLDLLDPR